ncbi:MAG: hypothetical protein IJ320_06185 [Phascolarctobacterium sp.]|nr:hypothetical protein [Phascolarctobacterium sp.]
MSNIRIWFSPDEIEEAIKYLSDKRKHDGMSIKDIYYFYFKKYVNAHGNLEWHPNYRFIKERLARVLDMLYWSGPRTMTALELIKDFCSSDDAKQIFEEYADVVKNLELDDNMRMAISNKFLPGFVYLLDKVFCDDEEYKYLKHYAQVADERKSKNIKEYKKKVLSEDQELHALFLRKVLIYLSEESEVILAGNKEVPYWKRIECCHNYIVNNRAAIEQIARENLKEDLDQIVGNAIDVKTLQEEIVARYNGIGNRLSTYITYHSILASDNDPVCKRYNRKSMENLRLINFYIKRIESIIEADEAFQVGDSLDDILDELEHQKQKDFEDIKSGMVRVANLLKKLAGQD